MEKIIHKVYAGKGGPKIDVTISLTHLKGNSSPYFSITNGNGAAHEDILRKYPKLKLFVDLHLADDSGAPMYAARNGFYFYAEGVKENGEKEYFATKEERTLKERENEHKAYLAFKEESGLSVEIALDIWHSVKAHTTYNSHFFGIAQRHMLTSNSVLTTLIVKRNNKALASHLRISLKDAEAIPAGLTMQQFEDLYVTPHRKRWLDEAQTAIKWLAEMEQVDPPCVVESIKGETYYFGAERYKEYLENKEARENEAELRVALAKKTKQ